MIFILSLLLTQTDTELTLKKKAEVEARASATVRSTLAPICLGRCELLGVEAEVDVRKATPDAMPGFESVAKVLTQVDVESLVVRVAADLKLSPSTRAGIPQAIRAALSGLSSEVDVRMDPFDFPQPRNDAASPIVISMPKSEAERAPASAPVWSIPPPAGVTPLDRLLISLAEAAPWLLGLVLSFLGVAFLRWVWRKPVDEVVEVDEAVVSSPGVEREAQVVESRLLRQCIDNQTLKTAVVRALLLDSKEDRLGAQLRLLGDDALADFHGTMFSAELPRAYALMRRAPKDPDALSMLESLIASELQNGAPDPRLHRLYTVAPPVFVAVVGALEKNDADALMLMAPQHLRSAYVHSLSDDAQRAFFVAALDVKRAPSGDALQAMIERVEAEILDKEASYLHARAAAEDLSDDPALLQRVIDAKPLWAGVARELFVTEESLLSADDETLDLLIVSSPPDAVVKFLAHAEKELALRLQGKLPAYLRALYDAEAGRATSDLALQRARKTVFSVYRRLSRKPQVGSQSERAQVRP
jgi:uncharacterized small protein (DUF1192 family)